MRVATGTGDVTVTHRGDIDCRSNGIECAVGNNAVTVTTELGSTVNTTNPADSNGIFAAKASAGRSLSLTTEPIEDGGMICADLRRRTSPTR